MDYLVYILGVLVMGLVCSMTIRASFMNRTKRPDGKQVGSRRRSVKIANKSPVEPLSPSEPDLTLSPKDFRPALQRALLHVRTPWGWPRHEERNRVGESRSNLSARMQASASRLVGGQRSTDRSAKAARTSESIRALVEDRYRRANRQAMAEMQYQKVKAPRLRDPSEPHDQMDNFGIKQAESIRHKLKLLSAMNGEPAEKESKNLRYVDLKDVKRPWGW